MSDVSADATAAPLAGVKVVELGGGLAAGLCTHLLAGYGADVVQVGDPGLTDDEDAYLSRGKRRIPADSDLAELLGAADVVVDARPRHAPVSPSAADIHAADPHLVVVAITPFGLDVVLFEAVSAFGTVGLSTGITGQIPAAGLLALTVMMFLGGTGPITLASALALRERARRYELPEERTIIG